MLSPHFKQFLFTFCLLESAAKEPMHLPHLATPPPPSTQKRSSAVVKMTMATKRIFHVGTREPTLKRGYNSRHGEHPLCNGGRLLRQLVATAHSQIVKWRGGTRAERFRRVKHNTSDVQSRSHSDAWRRSMLLSPLRSSYCKNGLRTS